MKTAIICPTAFITTFGTNKEERIQQYINGFSQVGEIVKKFPQFDVYAVDNTVEDESKIDKRIIQAIENIPNIKGKVFFFDNKYGKKNKGAGLIVAWKAFLSKFGSEYSHIISFEPRQKLTNYSFFERFVKQPDNYCRIWRPKAKKFRIFPITLTQILTGLVAFEKKILESYCNYANPKFMVICRTSIEDHIYNFFHKNKIQFQNVDELGILWHDTAIDKYVTF